MSWILQILTRKYSRCTCNSGLLSSLVLVHDDMMGCQPIFSSLLASLACTPIRSISDGILTLDTTCIVVFLARYLFLFSTGLGLR